MGRFPLHYDIVKSLIRYWYRLENLSTEFTLLKDAYECSKKLFLNHMNSWYAFIDKLHSIFNFNVDLTRIGKHKFRLLCNKSIMNHYVKDWYSSLHLYSEGKLSTYVKIKQKWGFESYLSVVRNFDYRRSMCKIRISSHSLKIETGRFTNTPRNERLCTKCSSNTIENELHFLITCVKYDCERQEIFKLIDSKYHNFSTLNTEQKLYWLLNCEEKEILDLVGRFISHNM